MLISSTGVVVAVVACLIGVFAAIIAVFVVMRNQRTQKNMPVIEVEAKFLGTKTDTKSVNQNFSSGTVDNYSGYQVTTNYIEFKPKQGKKISFKVKGKTAIKYNDGDVGVLKYQGYKFLEFSVKESGLMPKPTQAKRGQTVLFYGEAEGLDISIQSGKRVEYDKADIGALLSGLATDDSDWFFVLKRKDGAELQVERNGKNYDCALTVIDKQTMKTVDYSNMSEYVYAFFEGK